MDNTSGIAELQNKKIKVIIHIHDTNEELEIPIRQDFVHHASGNDYFALLDKWYEFADTLVRAIFDKYDILGAKTLVNGRLVTLAEAHEILCTEIELIEILGGE